MKRTFQVIILFSLLMLVTSASFAQYGGYDPVYTSPKRGFVSVTYSPSFPFGETANFVDRNSGRGAGITIGAILTEKVSLGISGNWHVLYQERGEVTVGLDESTDLTGESFRYVNALPVYLTGRFHPFGLKNISPYLGAGVGTAYVRLDDKIGGLTFREDGWQLGVFPEAGVNVMLGSKTAITAGVRYNYAFETDNLPTLNYLNVNVGLSFFY